MGNLRACFVVATIALAACGSSNNSTPIDAAKVIDAKVFLDAPPPMIDAPPVVDLSCLGMPLPTTATANVTVAGTVDEVAGLSAPAPLAGVTLDACKIGAPNCTGGNHYGSQVMSDAAGAFSIGPVATGGVPLNAYLTATHANDEITYVFPPTPVAKDLTATQFIMLNNTVIGLLGLIPGGGCTQSAGNGLFAVVVTDCAGTRITDSANIVLSIKQGGTIVAGATIIDAGSLSAMAAGLYLVCNVPPGTTNVGATYKTSTLLAHDVTSIAASTTETVVRPGP